MGSGAKPMPRRALFLDRDGVINVDHGYVGRVADFAFVEDIFELVRMARRLNYLPVVVTNQSGIARGYYSEEQFQAVTGFMLKRFADEGAAIERVYFCPSHPEATIARHRREDPRRKPGPGMFLDAIAELDIDPACSAMIGDQWSDAVAADAAGVAAIAILGEPHGPAPTPVPTVTRIATVRDAIGWLASLKAQA